MEKRWTPGRSMKTSSPARVTLEGSTEEVRALRGGKAHITDD